MVTVEFFIFNRTLASAAPYVQKIRGCWRQHFNKSHVSQKTRILTDTPKIPVGLKIKNENEDNMQSLITNRDLFSTSLR